MNLRETASHSTSGSSLLALKTFRTVKIHRNSVRARKKDWIKLNQLTLTCLINEHARLAFLKKYSAPATLFHVINEKIIPPCNTFSCNKQKKKSLSARLFGSTRLLGRWEYWSIAMGRNTSWGYYIIKKLDQKWLFSAEFYFWTCVQNNLNLSKIIWTDPKSVWTYIRDFKNYYVTRKA